MHLYENYFGLTPAILQRLGTFVVAWGLFESQLELATLVLLKRKMEKGLRPVTDCLQASELISRFRQAAISFHPEFAAICEALANAAEDLLVYRNAITHGRVLPPPAGGPLFINNAAWFSEKRKRSVTEAHISERLLDLAIESAGTLGLRVTFIQIAANSEPEEQLAIVSESFPSIRKAQSYANELRHLSALMKHEKY